MRGLVNCDKDFITIKVRDEKAIFKFSSKSRLKIMRALFNRDKDSITIKVGRKSNF